LQITFLGCFGGIDTDSKKTTCYLLNENTIIDAGTGLNSLGLDELNKIDDIILTHAHWDHVACLPLMVDAIFSLRKKPVNIWASSEILSIISKHMFNNELWPDFTKINMINSSDAIVKLNELNEKRTQTIGDCEIALLPANHGIPACGIRVKNNNKSYIFSGDSADCPEFWDHVNNDSTLDGLIVECSYPESLHELALLTMHLSVTNIKKRTKNLPENVKKIIVHRKPGFEKKIQDELELSNIVNLHFPDNGSKISF
jgi:3',5'-cyclic-nucleotide phosphodiesterase